ncbi:hypothetical protein [Methylocystis heyeri]|uniref:Uncharacterized protein n=1 Tax=Methylocystis heyeri TaxID=391905 RepID=A0A6B8K888_9HYPH|nr:hypothetical protein [Methylocystis heyeri]QGM44216.1 hypothetical protein H2LOC_000020 [Methylocystis heyeri]
MTMVTKEDFLAEGRVRYGRANPERIESELYELIIAKDWSAWSAKEEFKDDRANWGCGGEVVSARRVTEFPPVWTFQRFGMSRTELSDGRIVFTGGEHEDYYDPDFCIYNDVIVRHPDGRHEFFFYKLWDFPPTDFHSATLVGEEIIVVGSLSYQDLRRIGETQVYALDTTSFAMRKVRTSGAAPGWISRHYADPVGDSVVLWGGEIFGASGKLVSNQEIFELDLKSCLWRKRAIGDEALFPVSSSDYLLHKTPRYGCANPERVTNPFWLEMARRNWPPKQARLHFGDFLPPEPQVERPKFGSPEYPLGEDKEAEAKRNEAILAYVLACQVAGPRENKVWTALRDEMAVVRRADGSVFSIAGQLKAYGAEALDEWSYNDIIIRCPDGAVEIYAYRLEDFPTAWALCAMEAEGAIWIFASGLKSEAGPLMAILRLDPETMAMTRIWEEPPVRVITSSETTTLEQGRIVFATSFEPGPEPRVSFDPRELSWRLEP